MQFLSQFRQPQAIGVVLFAAATVALGSVIITGHSGLAIAGVLANLAQPICACAIAVLVYLAITGEQSDITL